MKTQFLIFVNCFMIFAVSAQHSNEQIALKIENDKLVLQDKYYTSGFFLTYRKSLEQNFLFNNTEENRLQFNITLGNETYTPSNLQSTNPSDFDRPYAGWFFVKTEVGQIKENSALLLAIETGITGEEALSGKFQTWAHELFNIDVPTWTQEIEFKFLVNLKAKYILNKRLGKFHAIQYEAEPSLGTKDIYLSNALTYTFGRFNDFKVSSRNDFIDTSNTNAFFGFVSFGHRFVAHNTLIQGSLDYKDTTFTTNRTPHVFQFKIGSTLKFKRNTLKLIYNFNTKETPNVTSHAYGTLSFSRNF